MTSIFLIVSSIVAILDGIYIALLGFRKNQPEKNKPEHRERIELWHKKIGGFAKYGGIVFKNYFRKLLYFNYLVRGCFRKKDSGQLALQFALS
jgi:hypothetical protein